MSWLHQDRSSSESVGTVTLRGRNVFLSASFPSGEHGRPYEPFDPGAIPDAVTAVVRAVLVAEGRLLLGEHPTITPLVLMVAAELDHKHAIDVYQSRWFEEQITPETVPGRLATIDWRSHHSAEASYDSARPSNALLTKGKSTCRCSDHCRKVSATLCLEVPGHR